MRLRTKIILPLLCFSIALAAYLSGYWMPRSLANIEAGFQGSLELHLDSVDEGLVPLLLGHQLDAVYENLDTLMKKNQDWIELQLLDAEGRLLYPLKRISSAQAGAPGQDVHTIERRIRYLDRDLGSILLRVDFAPRLSELRKRHWELMSVMLGGILIFVVITGFVLDRLVRRPVDLLARASQRLAEGDFDSTLVKTGNDEVGILVDSFQNMRTAMRQYRSIRERAEENLAERTILAELSAEIGFALAKQGDLHSVLDACTRALVRQLDVAFARIWVLNAAENVLELQASAGMYTRIDGSHSRVPVGKFKIGVIAQERKPHITNTVIGDVRVHDQEWAEREGMVSFAGHPLTIEDKLVGVMALFSRKPLTDVTLKALASVSNEIAVGIERILAGESLRTSEEQYRLLLDTVQDGIWVIDKDSVTTFVNPRMAEILGYAPKEMVGKHLFSFMDDRGKTIAASNVERRKQGIKEQHGFEFIKKDGSRIYARLETGPILDAEGQYTGAIASVSDITERREAELRLRASEQAFRAVVENSPDVIIRYDRKGRRIYVNPEFERVNHLTAQQVLGKTPAEISTELAPMADVFTEKLTAAMASGAVSKIDLSWTKNGKPVCWFVRIMPEFDEAGNVVSALTIWSDISERKRMEDELRGLNEELEQRVKDRTAELEQKNKDLEKMNKLFVGRELKMVELKQKLKMLGHIPERDA